MECTSILGKPPPPKRKKPQTEVGILEARLESIESAYSERLRHMELLLNKVLPASQVQELMHGNLGSSSDQQVTTKAQEKSLAHSQQHGTTVAGLFVDNGFEGVDSLKESALSVVPHSDQDSNSARVNGR
jgi:hypothetical protein